MAKLHVLILSFPTHGSINPSLQLAKRLTRMGVKVTFVTSVYAQNSMCKTTTIQQGMSFAPFSDGYDNGFQSHNHEHFLSEFSSRGSHAIAELVTSSAKASHPVSHLIYAMNQKWAGEVAHRLHIPSTALWMQPATVFDIFYYYFHGYGDVISNSSHDPASSIELPGLPSLSSRDLPTFLLPSNTYRFALPLFKGQIDTLDAETSPRVLVNTFDTLEPEALKAIEKLNFIPIGPLVPSEFLDGKDPSDTSIGGNCHYFNWLNSTAKSSVVYVSFGTIAVFTKQQIEEVARGLLQCNRPFLWVIREKLYGEKQEDELSCMDKLERLGRIVPWCSQAEVLSHPSVGCFVTHCGWNSSLESLVFGIPMVGFPQFIDQTTNAKLIEDVWKTGVRVVRNEDGIVKGDELKRCIDMVMEGGDSGEEIGRNAKKWKDLAREAVKEGGSADSNLKAFLQEIEKGQIKK